jgi:tryptophan 2,3-dioxygenase
MTRTYDFGALPAAAAGSPEPAGVGDRRAGLTYRSYLRLDVLLRQQVPVTDPPARDELLFITAHQAYELWFKQLLHELESICAAMLAGRAWLARELFRRVHGMQRLLVTQLDILETMPPQEFSEFRTALGTASGLQSVQFRELEFLSGAKDGDFVRRARWLTAAERAALQRRLAEPSVWDAYLGLLRTRGLPVAGDEQVMRALVEVAADRAHHDDLWVLAEDLLTHDTFGRLWRCRHVQLVERLIGDVSGTGGSSGHRYLRTRTDLRYYPLLWRLRNEIAHPGPP